MDYCPPCKSGEPITFDAFGGQSIMDDDITLTLKRLEKNLTSVKSNLEKKRARVSMADINQKLDRIIELLTKKQ